MFSTVAVQLFGALIVSVCAASIVLPAVRSLAVKRGWVDRPDGDRKIHRRPIAVVGGIGIVVGTAAGVIYLVSIADTLPIESLLPPFPILLGAAVMFATGLYDDLRGLSFRRKFVLQAVAAYLLILGGAHFELSSLGLDIEAGSFFEATLSIPITLLWIVGLINAINLVDGLDGLASGLSLIAFSSLALVFAISGNLAAVAIAIPFVGGLTAFLFHNFNPARIFMGDSGSYFLGYCLAAYSLYAPTHGDPIIAFLVLFVILGIPLLDTLYAMLRRALKGSSPFIPDRDHIHHRLIRRFSHRVAVLILYAVATGLGMSGILMAVLNRGSALTIFAGSVGFCLLFTVVIGHLSSTAEEAASGLRTADQRADTLVEPSGSQKGEKLASEPWREALPEVPVA